MRYKILTVDDSKTVRIIVKKAFKSFDCDILEAANGVEGLAVAAKEAPDVCLLDITMPVMDGVEMLTKLKSDPLLKSIPVVMLTAEGGREHVLKIAKIGVRDYIVKPFKEELLVEKVMRIIDIKPLSEANQRMKTIFDPADILVVEDKPAIIQQIQEGLKHTPWRVHGVSTTGEAIDFCGRTTPDLVMSSLSLPEDGGFTLFRMLRTNIKTKFTPVFALVVKTETAAQQQALQVGFSAIITKPIEYSELEMRIAKAMNLDTSLRYYSIEENTLVFRLPELMTPVTINEVIGYMKGKVSGAVDTGVCRSIVDISKLKTLDMPIIKLLFQYMQSCSEVSIQYVLVGNAAVIKECKGFEDTKNWVFFDSLEQAKAGFKGDAAPAAPDAPAAPAAAPAAG
jgi:two-component system, cell cycle response regulator